MIRVLVHLWNTRGPEKLSYPKSSFLVAPLRDLENQKNCQTKSMQLRASQLLKDPQNDQSWSIRTLQIFVRRICVSVKTRRTSSAYSSCSSFDRITQARAFYCFLLKPSGFLFLDKLNLGSIVLFANKCFFVSLDLQRTGTSKIKKRVGVGLGLNSNARPWFQDRTICVIVGGRS